MRYKVVHTTSYNYSEVVPICHNEVHLTPRDQPQQTCFYDKLLIKPEPAALQRRIDYFGNHVTAFALQEGHQKLVVTAVSKVEVLARPAPDPLASPPWEQVRDLLPVDRHSMTLAAYQFTFDSPHIHPSAKLAEFAAESFTPGRPILDASLDLTKRIFTEFKYDPAATTISTPLGEVLRTRRGVCQDFAHLQIGCMRSLGLAARYVSGYLLTTPPPGQQRLLGSDASHAWLSVYCGSANWVDVDPTNNLIPSTQHITLAWGRDYSDVCPIRGVFMGGGSHSMNVNVDVLTLG